ncbi:hypothetical protein JB92DRAFT_2835969 [Gautieria morchelliformis]|nr:hypothetical protein JB92DRAFT_2835969 [Gautieria morchelliformis]
MPRVVIDSPKEEIEEITPLPFKGSLGCVLKLSMALLNPSNVVKVPGQPHSTRRLGESEEPKRKKAKPTGKQKQKEAPVPNISAKLAMPIPLATITHDNAYPEGWLKDLDGMGDLPEIHSKKLKEREILQSEVVNRFSCQLALQYPRRSDQSIFLFRDFHKSLPQNQSFVAVH